MVTTLLTVVTLVVMFVVAFVVDVIVLTDDVSAKVEFAVMTTANVVELPSAQCSSTVCGPLNAATYVHDCTHECEPEVRLVVVQFSGVMVPHDAPTAHEVPTSDELELAPNRSNTVTGGAMQPPTPMYDAYDSVWYMTVDEDALTVAG